MQLNQDWKSGALTHYKTCRARISHLIFDQDPPDDLYIYIYIALDPALLALPGPAATPVPTPTPVLLLPQLLLVPLSSLARFSLRSQALRAFLWLESCCRRLLGSN